MAESTVIEKLRLFKAGLLAGEQAHNALMISEWLKTRDAVQAEMIKVVDEIAKAKKTGLITPAMLYRRERYQQLLAQLNAGAEKYAGSMAKSIAEQQAILIKAGMGDAVDLINASYAGVSGMFNKLPVEALENMVGLTAAGTPLATLFDGIGPEAGMQMTNALMKGLALGKSPAEVARWMVQATDIVPNRAIRIARSETLRAYRTATQAQFAESQIVQGYYRVASKSRRTCLGCLVADGAFVEIDVPFEEHAQGRCSMIPALDGVKKPLWSRGREWLMAQSPEFQREFIGPGLYEAWDAKGKPSLQTLIEYKENATWGGHWRAKTIGGYNANPGYGSNFYSYPSTSALDKWKQKATTFVQQVTAPTPSVVATGKKTTKPKKTPTPAPTPAPVVPGPGQDGFDPDSMPAPDDDEDTPAPTPAPKPKRTRKKKTPEPDATPEPSTLSPMPDQVDLQGPFPGSVDDVEVIRQLGGSTGAQLVRDRRTGVQYVMKRGATPDHLREEAQADDAYRALGLNVPPSRVYETATGPVKLSRYIEGETLGTLTGQRRAAAVAQLRRGYAADALLGNWDVVGAGEDNVLVDKDGVVWRIDNGGALRYRAQGGAKGAAWSRHPVEVWTMRDRSKNPKTAAAMDGLDFMEIVDQIDDIGPRRRALLGSIRDTDLRSTIEARLDSMSDVATSARVLKADKWVTPYIDRFSRHRVGLASSGVLDRLPASLTRQTKTGVTAVDEKGRRWDNLRSRNDSVMHSVADYIKGAGGDMNMVTRWLEDQAGSSWSDSSQAVKVYFYKQRTAKQDAYYWRDYKDSEGSFNSWKKKWGIGKTDETMAAWHAFNYEFSRRVDYENNNRKAGTVTVVRTESKDVMNMYGLKRGDKGVRVVRGVAESTSIYKSVEVHGSEITRQAVPHHRVLGMYFYTRQPGWDHGAFLTDDENEFLAMLEDIPFDYGK